MTHPPKKLALLISLIGAGVSPYACASSEVRIVGVPPSALAALLTAPAATALDRTRWSPGFIWRTEEGAFNFAPPPQTQGQVGRLNEDWAPGEALAESRRLVEGIPRSHASDVAPTNPALGVRDLEQGGSGDALLEAVEFAAVEVGSRPPMGLEAVDLPTNLTPKAHGRVHRLRAFVQGFSTKQKTQPVIAKVGLHAIARSAILPMPGVNVEARPQSFATVQSGAASSVQPDARAASSHADRLMKSLAAVLMEDVTALSSETVLLKLAERFPAAIGELPTPEAAVATRSKRTSAERLIGLRDIVVAPQSSKVLRNLEAILSNERDEVGAIHQEASGAIVATQAEKVLATLGRISPAQGVPEDGAARRTRKLAAAKLKAQAVEAAAIAQAAMYADIDLTPPVAVDLPAPATTTAGIDAPRFAMEPLPLPLPMAVSAPEREARRSPFGGEQVAVSEKALDGVRGGFVANGLNISFGIERAVYINGTLVTTTSLNISDLGRISAGRSTTAFDSGTLALIQSGAGNSVSASTISAASVGTIVQNTLDGQKIQNVTVINATANSLGLLRGLNLGSSLRGAVIDSLRR